MYYKLQNNNILLLKQLQKYYGLLDMFHVRHVAQIVTICTNTGWGQIVVNVYVSDDDVDMVMMTTPEVIKNFAGLPSTSASPSNLNMLLTGPIIFAVLCLNFSR